MAEDLERVLESLRPARDGKIMSIVEAAGIDVSSWAFKQDGSPVANPAANPHYCYEWAFGGGGEPIALCIWHRHLTIDGDAIVYQDNVREYALSLDRIAIDRANPAHVKSRARDQAKRARNFDSLVQYACRKALPVRVILLLGMDKENEELGWEASRVRYRHLDSALWFVESYGDMDGRFRIVRGVRPGVEATPPPDEPIAAQPDNSQKTSDEDSVVEEASRAETYVDQFSLPEAQSRQEAAGWVYPRSPEVRRAVLERAAGYCECCRSKGFEMVSGAVFLETHHVIPLAEAGPDQPWNVVALCPNDHRRAHFGADRGSVRDDFIKHLTSLYPQAEPALREASARSRGEQK